TTVSVSLDVLFAGFGSVTMPGCVTVAVFVIDAPPKPGAIGAVTVYVTVLPTLMLIVSLIAPLPDGAPQLAPLVAAQVRLVTVMPVGGASATAAPMTLFGPAFETTTVYVVDVPVATLVTPSDFAIARLAVPVACSVAVAGALLVTPWIDASAPAAIVLI